MSDGELLAKVIQSNDFFQSVLYNDSFEDWNLAKELGEFLVRIEPDSEIMGHALLTRAHRHLGNRQRALDELKQMPIAGFKSGTETVALQA
jgi:hypothetical protein